MRKRPVVADPAGVSDEIAAALDDWLAARRIDPADICAFASDFSAAMGKRVPVTQALSHAPADVATFAWTASGSPPVKAHAAKASAQPRRRVRLEGIAGVGRGRVEKGRHRAVHVAQPTAPQAADFVRAHCARGIADAGAQGRAGVGKSQKGDHVVLIDTIPRDSDRTDQHAGSVDRYAPRKDLDAVR